MVPECLFFGTNVMLFCHFFWDCPYMLSSCFWGGIRVVIQWSSKQLLYSIFLATLSCGHLFIYPRHRGNFLKGNNYGEITLWKQNQSLSQNGSVSIEENFWPVGGSSANRRGSIVITKPSTLQMSLCATTLSIWIFHLWALTVILPLWGLSLTAPVLIMAQKRKLALLFAQKPSKLGPNGPHIGWDFTFGNGNSILKLLRGVMHFRQEANDIYSHLECKCHSGSF